MQHTAKSTVEGSWWAKEHSLALVATALFYAESSCHVVPSMHVYLRVPRTAAQALTPYPNSTSGASELNVYL